MNTTRRSLLKSAAAAAALPFAAPLARAEQRRYEPQVGEWRTVDLVLDVALAEAQGTSRVWLPLPDLDTDFQRTLATDWSGNASAARVVSDPASGVRMLHAEFAPSVEAPAIRLTTRVQTRGRAVDWNKPAAAAEDPAVLQGCLKPTQWIPTDGIVKATSMKAIGAAETDEAKVRAIYDWILANAHREPTVRGCGRGDVKALLETGNLAGKCADLNALFVGLCRSAGVPARDIYGVRVAPSEFGYAQLGANPASLKGAQHCRAEVYLKRHGWVAMDPADVLKVMRQETAEWIKDPADPLIAPVAKALNGCCERNWVGYNRGHDVALVGASTKTVLPFLMYPNGENAKGRFDELAPDAFKYAISAKDVAAA